MIVCVCHRISHREIERHATACDSFDELQLNTGVATGCGRCGDCARSVFDEARQQPTCGLVGRLRVAQPAAALA
ncbi:(2Fe-2S)-binding protein [Methylibium petroleiphilum]|uniref:(2Fe-2S)-binding protein n=1 Tax=Methylibium petroleiphilum TaxID=105560 RepID=UPI001AC82671|nr:(2Fe-2S)-binding protein [Methylibium petroleiphilum]MBN9203277.1 (2Fe-2S)-binding protein [Methylibium petroleiphilum]